MGIAKELLVVAVTVDPGVEDDWNRWYNDVHLPEIATCPGFVSAQRYVAQEGQERRYMTLYELDGPAALDSAEFAARRGWGPFGSQVQFRTSRFSRIAQMAGDSHD
jgi:antibiotic biosynthesis monooxygenase (ABM) superfamily enzyme